MADIEHNLALYNAVRSVPKEAKKPFTNGRFTGTDINPMWRIKCLTEQFGMCGVGWYTEILSERAETHGDVTIAVVDINLYVKVNGEWSKPIYGTGGNNLERGSKGNDEGYKMAYTDAISVACKALGIGADVYFEKDTSSKYAASYTDAQKAATATNKAATTNVSPKQQNARTGQNKPYASDSEELAAKIAYIMGNCPNELMAKAMASYGEALDKLTNPLADKLIERIKAANAAQ